MLAALGLRTLFEVFLVCLVFWAIFNESKLIAFERHIIAKIRRRHFKVIKPAAPVRTNKIYNR